jgi:hypothetical protein
MTRGYHNDGAINNQTISEGCSMLDTFSLAMQGEVLILEVDISVFSLVASAQAEGFKYDCFHGRKSQEK